MKGILVHVLRSALGDTTNGGVTSKEHTFVLSGPGIPEIFETNDRTPGLLLEKNGRFGYRAVPENTEGKWTMFGGNYIDSSDSRFRAIAGGPIAVHDRIEG
jgi:hypothetical protein